MKKNLVIFGILGIALVGLGGCEVFQVIVDAFGGPQAIADEGEKIVKELVPFPFNQLVHPLFALGGLLFKGDN